MSDVARPFPSLLLCGKLRVNVSLHRTAWRWHFYAGLIVLPFLVWLAVTGGLYLYKPEIERAVYGDWIALPATAAPMPAGAMIARVERQTGGTVTQITRPGVDTESWRMTYLDGDGARRTAFVDPGDGDVIGTTHYGGVMETIRSLHGLAITGPVGNAVIEIVAGWVIVLVVTGFLLWWPRGAGRRLLALRGRPKERLFWRDFHASTGAVAGAIILFLAVTGMPWSIVWGDAVQQMLAASGGDRPAPPVVGSAAPAHHHDEANATLPWSLQAAAPPAPSAPADVGPDAIVAAADARGVPRPWTLSLPRRPDAPYTLSHLADRAADTRVVYLDPATGGVLLDYGIADFGLLAQAIEWGVYTHMGTTYGEPNRIVMLLGCIGILLLAGSAPVLWWKRRRAGRLEAPPRAPDPKRGRRLIAAMAVLGLVYPLTGLTMLVAWVGERLWARRRRFPPSSPQT